MPKSLVIAIEDNESDIFLIKEALAQLKITTDIEFYQYGVEALTRIHQIITETPSSLRMILLDLNLPDMDGREILKRLKEDEKTSWIPVVIVSTSNSRPDLQFCYSHHANSYIVKPMGFEELKHSLESIFHYWVNINHL